MAAADILKNFKITISLCNGLTDRHSIWHDDALALRTRPAVEIPNL